MMQLPSAVILEPKIMKSVTVSIVSPSICHEVIGLDFILHCQWVLYHEPYQGSLSLGSGGFYSAETTSLEKRGGNEL